MDIHYLLRPIPHREVFAGDGTFSRSRSAATELEIDWYHMGGIPYRAPPSFGFGADSYAARWLSDP